MAATIFEVLAGRLSLETGPFEQSLQKARGAMSSFTAGLASAAGIITGFGAALAGLAGIATGIGLIKEAISSAAEAEVVQVRLGIAVRNMGQAAGVTSEFLNDLANQLQRTTVATDDAIIEMGTMLLKMENIKGTDMFERAIRGALDLSAATGQDATGAMNMLARAMEDPAHGMMMLRRSGIMFSEEIKEAMQVLVLEGRHAEAQLILLGEVNKRFVGAAEEYAKTFQGEFMNFRKMVGEALEALGKPLIEVLTPYMARFKEWATFAADWITENQPIIKRWIATTIRDIEDGLRSIIHFFDRLIVSARTFRLLMGGVVGWAALAYGEPVVAQIRGAAPDGTPDGTPMAPPPPPAQPGKEPGDVEWTAAIRALAAGRPAEAPGGVDIKGLPSLETAKARKALIDVEKEIAEHPEAAALIGLGLPTQDAVQKLKQRQQALQEIKQRAVQSEGQAGIFGAEGLFGASPDKNKAVAGKLLNQLGDALKQQLSGETFDPVFTEGLLLAYRGALEKMPGVTEDQLDDIERSVRKTIDKLMEMPPALRGAFSDAFSGIAQDAATLGKQIDQQTSIFVKDEDPVMGMLGLVGRSGGEVTRQGRRGAAGEMRRMIKESGGSGATNEQLDQLRMMRQGVLEAMQAINVAEGAAREVAVKNAMGMQQAFLGAFQNIAQGGTGLFQGLVDDAQKAAAGVQGAANRMGGAFDDARARRSQRAAMRGPGVGAAGFGLVSGIGSMLQRAFNSSLGNAFGGLGMLEHIQALMSIDPAAGLDLAISNTNAQLQALYGNLVRTGESGGFGAGFPGSSNLPYLLTLPTQASQTAAWLKDLLDTLLQQRSMLGSAHGMAGGGVVTRPTFAMLGESGPEAVIPLSGPRTYMGGVNVTVNLPNARVTPQLAGDIADALERELARRGTDGLGRSPLRSPRNTSSRFVNR